MYICILCPEISMPEVSDNSTSSPPIRAENSAIDIEPLLSASIAEKTARINDPGAFAPVTRSNPLSNSS